MATSPNNTFMILTASAILIFLSPLNGNPVGIEQKGCYQKLERWAASYCQEPCIPSFKEYIKRACEEQQTHEEIIERCCPETPLNKMYF